jgi:cytochrome c peroxidase
VLVKHALLSIAAAVVVAMIGAEAPGAVDNSAALSPQALQEIAQVEAEIDRIEAQTIERLAASPDNQVQQIELLGKLILYDKQLSVNRNEACAFCHMPEAGFTGPVSELNRTTAAYPGSVRTRFSDRKPQTHAYAPLAPVLHYNPGQGDLVGGNFWDMRATGRRLGNPAAEQAQGPPTNPVEMGLPDIACAVYRASQRPYRALFERVWGEQAFAIAWPSDVEQVCARPGPPPAGDALPLHLGPLDRGRAGTTFDQMAQSIAGYEASAEVTAFTSKYDAVLAGKAQFTPQEQAGYDLFRGKAKCNACHVTAGRARTPCSPTSLPATSERQLIRGSPTTRKIDPMPWAMSPIRQGRRSSMAALAVFSPGGISSVSPQRWMRDGSLAPNNQARMQVPTLRNVDKRPYPEFVKAYGHNGYFTSLKAIVHFYNTRDVLPRCRPNDVGEGTTCWSAPESTANMNTSRVGRLGLSDAEEDALVTFMQTLTDGFMPRDQP